MSDELAMVYFIIEEINKKHEKDCVMKQYFESTLLDMAYFTTQKGTEGFREFYK
jgi:hypothetical protein